MNKKIKKILILSLVYLFCFGLFDVVNAAVTLDTTYKLLEPLPIVGTNVSNFGVYLSQMFKLAISIAAVLAVLQLSIGGFKYMSEETFTGKSDAKERITNALYGLVLILASYLLLNTINPDLVNSDLNIPKVGGASSSQPQLNINGPLPPSHVERSDNVIPAYQTPAGTFNQTLQQEPGGPLPSSFGATLPPSHTSSDNNMIPTYSTFDEAVQQEQINP